MGGLTILALVLAIAVILVPVVFVWYLNFGGLRAAQRARKVGFAREKEAKEVAKG